MKAITTMFGKPHPDGRQRVYWLIRGPGLSLRWVHKGWLMPEVKR